MKSSYCSWAALAVVLALGQSSSVYGQDPGLKAETLFEQDGVHPGEVLRGALRVTMNEGYHVNANEPLEDYLIPTVLKFEAGEEFELTEIVYPEPLHLKTGGSDTPLAVYENEFLIGFALSTGESVKPGEYSLTGSLRYQACDDRACYRPMTEELAFSVNVVPPDQKPAEKHAAVIEKIPFSGKQGADTPETEKPEAETKAAEESKPSSAAQVDTETLMAELNDFKILATTGGYLPPDDFIAFVDAAESGEAQQGMFEGRGPIAIIGLVLVGGLLLNLTPCVLPMIPINLAIIGAGTKAGSRARGFALGGTYGIAMALVYGVLGLVAVLTGTAFGQLNSSPWFNLAIAIIFVPLALAMFDVISIDFSKYQSKLAPGGKGKGTFFLAFFMGSVAALLAGACVAPVVIAVILFASDLYAKGQAMALLLPFLLGVGMALPWPFAGAGLSFMPKPGMWMVRVKQAFGIFILGFAAYYGYLSYELFSNRWVDSEAVASSVEEKLEEGWYASLYEGLQVAKSENKPVLIDMWATWCKNCLTMDKTTFKDEAVLARLEDFVKVKFQAEDPSASPANEVMEHFDAVGLPTYAIIEPKTAGE